MLLQRNAVHRLAVARPLGGAPLEDCGVELRHVVERAARREVLLDEANKALDLAFRERVAGLAELRPEADARHERRVVGLPHGPALAVAVQDHALHVVGQHELRHAHQHECVDHADEQALLPRVREELHVERPAVVAHHREAGHSVLVAEPVHDLHEAPVHLIALARPGMVAAPAVALRLRRELALRRHEVLVVCDVALHGGQAALVAFPAYSVEVDRRVRHPLSQQ